MFADWLVTQLQPDMPGLWLLISLAAGWIGYAVLAVRPELARRLPWLSALRLAGIPYAGLLLGGLSPRLMGLSEIDWLASAGWGAGLILGLLGFLLLLRPTMIRPQNATDRNPQGFPVVQAGLRELHWAFLRGGLWAIFLSLATILPAADGVIGSMVAQPAYWAVWSAALIALVESFLTGRLHPSNRIRQITHLFTLLTTTVLFLYTRNFWLCWLLHAGISLVMGSRSRQMATE